MVDAYDAASSTVGPSSPTDELKHQLAAAITGVASPLSASPSSSSAPTTDGDADDITPFPSPGLRTLSRECRAGDYRAERAAGAGS